MKTEIADLLQDGEAWSLRQIAAATLLPDFLITPIIRTLITDNVIMFSGRREAQDTWRKRSLKTRQPHLDAQVDEMLASSLEGHQPNDETTVVAPLDPEDIWAEFPPIGLKDSPHWILDALGWGYREPCEVLTDKSQPCDSPVRWMGGKSKMIEDLVRWYPPHDTYVECFGGSLKPFFSKSPSPIEVVNDFYGSLINFWRVASQHGERLAHACNSIPASRTLHRFFQREDGTRDPWTRAVMFGALVRFSFNGKPWSSYGGSPSSPPGRIDPQLLEACGRRLSDGGVYIENLDFRKLIERYNKKSAKVVFFYLDPPYYKTAGYADDFPDAWHTELADLMVEIDKNGNKVLMTNSPPAMEAYKKWLPGGWRYNQYEVGYSAAGSAEGRGKVMETIISNFPINVKQQGSMFT